MQPPAAAMSALFFPHPMDCCAPNKPASFQFFPLSTQFFPVFILLVRTFQFQSATPNRTVSRYFSLVFGRISCLFQFSVIVDCIPFSFYKFSLVVAVCAGNSTIDPKRTNIKSCSRLRIGKICTRDQTRFKQSYSPPQSQTATKAKQQQKIRTKYIKISVSRFVNATLSHPICFSYVFFLFAFDSKVRSFVRTLSIFEFIIIATVWVVLDAGTNVTQPFDEMEM